MQGAGTGGGPGPPTPPFTSRPSTHLVLEESVLRVCLQGCCRTFEKQLVLLTQEEAGAGRGGKGSMSTRALLGAGVGMWVPTGLPPSYSQGTHG